MAKTKKRPAKKKAKKAKTKPKSKVKKAVKKQAAKKSAKKSAKRIAKKPSAKKSAKKHAAPRSKAPQKKTVALSPVEKSVKPFAEEESKRSQLMGSSMLKDTDLDEELGDDEVDLAVEADEDVEEELTLDGDDEDEGFPEKPEGLLDDTDEYHTH